MTTLKDVARVAGVSVSTASYVMSGNGLDKIRDVTRNRVLTAADSLGYKVNMAGRLLQGGPSQTIGIIECQRSIPIFSELMQMVSRKLDTMGYRTNYRIANVNPDNIDKEQEAVNDAVACHVDGIILAFYNKFRTFPREKCTVPLTIFNGTEPDVKVNHEHGTYLAVQHLIGHGHRKIGYVLPDNPHNLSKLNGYRRALCEAGIEPDSNWLAKIFPTHRWREELDRLVFEEKVTAVCASNDTYAVNTMQYFKWRGIRIPDDVAMFGYDGLSYVDWLEVPLSTVVQPVELLGETIARVMLDKIARKDMKPPAEPYDLLPRLHLGQSCGCRTRQGCPDIAWADISVYLK
jgi:LacI family transcriptional regulator